MVDTNWTVPGWEEKWEKKPNEFIRKFRGFVKLQQGGVQASGDVEIEFLSQAVMDLKTKGGLTRIASAATDGDIFDAFFGGRRGSRGAVRGEDGSCDEAAAEG